MKAEIVLKEIKQWLKYWSKTQKQQLKAWRKIEKQLRPKK